MRLIKFLSSLLMFASFCLQANVQLTLEHANTPNSLVWGLMGRKSLPENHGMIFSLPKKEFVTLWMFNCFIDLEAAFLDENLIIAEIHSLKAFPHLMDPARPVKSIRDLSLYPSDDPVVRFFNSQSVSSKRPVKYVIEMGKDWFKKHNIVPGNRVEWRPGRKIATINLPP